MDSGAPVDRTTVAKAVVGFAVAGLVVYLFGWAIGWGDILRTLRSADFGWLAVACLSSTVALVIWTKAWQEVLAILSVKIPFRSLVVTYFAATFADYATPFGKAGGNPFIAYVLSTDRRANYQESLAGVVTADLLNLLPFFTFAAVGLVAIAVRGSVPARVEPLLLGLGALAVAVPLLVALGWRHRSAVESILTSLVAPLDTHLGVVDAESVGDRVEGFYERLDHLRGHPRLLAETLVFSFTGWLFFALPLYLAARAVGVELAPVVVLFVVPASTMASFVPTPGGLGGVEVAVTALLVALVGLAPGVAAGIALLYRVASYWYVLGVSGVAAFYEVYTH